MLSTESISASSLRLIGSYDYRLVALSISISILAAYASFDLAGRVSKSEGALRTAWLSGGAVAMGIGIWSMHYVGMEAFRLPIPVAYDWPTVLVSLLAAILSSGVALFIVKGKTLGAVETVIGSLAMGGGIAGMHYIGMRAMRISANCEYDMGLVSASILLAVVISSVALRLDFALKNDASIWGARKIGAALVMGTAISSMHYVGMAAVRFLPESPSHKGDLAHAVSVSSLGLTSLIVAVIVILSIAIVAAVNERRFAIQSEHLEEGKSLLQAVFDNITEGVVIVDRDRNIIQANQPAVSLLNLPEKKLTVQEVISMFETYLPDGRRLRFDELPSARAFREDFLKDCKLRIDNRATGKKIFVEISTSAIRNAEGTVVQVMICYRDITTQAQMDETRSRLAAIVESSEDAIVGKNDKGIVTSWNRSAERLFGYMEEEILGRSIRLLLPQDRQEEEDAILRRIQLGETLEHFETTRRRKDGHVIDVSLTISPIRDSSGQIVGASKIARDITHSKQIERQARQSEKMEALGQLTGGIAHDFNNLLGVITGNLELLERALANDDAMIKRVQTAKKAALRGADLTRRLLVFSRKEELTPRLTHLRETIDNVVEIATRTIGPEIHISLHCDDSVPAILVDPSRLENALLNIALNARDAMPKGGSLTFNTRVVRIDESYPAVKSEELKPGTYACVSVSDNGRGMSKMVLDRAFEPFFTTKPRGKGTGLGLAMVYGFVRQSDGVARIYSEPDHGTTVSLYFPIPEVGPHQVLEQKRSRLQPTTSVGKVLVVDDEPDLLEIAVAFLEEMGYHFVLQACDGPSALAVLERERDIDLLVTDVIMPGSMNGVELASRAREKSPSIKVIFSSGFPADALGERTGEAVNGPLLHKPFQREEFQDVIRKVMEGDVGA
jgi:PAS domain S-box-containing protein